MKKGLKKRLFGGKSVTARSGTDTESDAERGGARGTTSSLPPPGSPAQRAGGGGGFMGRIIDVVRGSSGESPRVQVCVVFVEIKNIVERSTII